MNQNINLNLLKYFYEVVTIGNITKASEKMLVSQPAITKAIKELEKELDVKLLERNKKGVIPTNEGKVLYDHTKNMFSDLNTTLNVLENTKNSEQNLYIGATTTNFLNQLIIPLNTFKKKYPNVHIHMVLEDIKILNDMKRLGKLDIIIKNDYELFDDFKLIETFTITDKFVASSTSYKELENKILTLKELLEYPLVLLSNITHGRRNFDDYLNSKNIHYKPTYEFNSYSLCKELIKNGFGIGIGNPIHYKSKEFIILKTDFELPSRCFNIGYITTSKNNLIKEFINIIKKEND